MTSSDTTRATCVTCATSAMSYHVMRAQERAYKAWAQLSKRKGFTGEEYLAGYNMITEDFKNGGNL